MKKQSQSPGFARKSEARMSKSEIRALDGALFEKTKPISGWPIGRNYLCNKGLYKFGPSVGSKNKANLPAVGRKSEAPSSRRETWELDRALFEKTKPISLVAADINRPWVRANWAFTWCRLGFQRRPQSGIIETIERRWLSIAVGPDRSMRRQRSGCPAFRHVTTCPCRD